jgi:hypothetical protein
MRKSAKIRLTRVHPRPIKKLRMKLLFSILAILVTTVTIAQPLPELLDSLAQQNPELRALDTEYRAAQELAPQVSQLPKPEVGLGLFPRAVETRLGAQRAQIGRAHV